MSDWADLASVAALPETATGLAHGPVDATPSGGATLLAGSQRPPQPETLHSSPAGVGVTPAVTLVADHPTHPNLIRARCGRHRLGYTIRDTYGWAIVANRATLARFGGAGSAEADARAAAVRALYLLASVVLSRVEQQGRPVVLASRGAR